MAIIHPFPRIEKGNSLNPSRQGRWSGGGDVIKNASENILTWKLQFLDVIMRDSSKNILNSRLSKIKLE